MDITNQYNVYRFSKMVEVSGILVSSKDKVEKGDKSQITVKQEVKGGMKS